MTYKIFFRPKDSTKLAQYSQTDYAKEAILQKALADAPEVIAGFTTTGDAPTRLMLVKREMQLRAPGVAGTLSLDHLYVDTKGVPVLVEVKRSSDTRTRREVVAQMLDYAANAAQWWTADVIRDALQRRADAASSVEDLLAEHEISMSEQELIGEIVANLRDGKVRLMFVADTIPPSLRRIIEFLNTQMTPAEVLGVEVQQYEGPAGTVFVPRLVGGTTAAKDKKLAASGGPAWDRELLLEAAESRCPPEEYKIVLELLYRLQKQGGDARWGSGAQPGFGAWYAIDGHVVALWNLRVPHENKKARIEFRPADLLTKDVVKARVKDAMQELSYIPQVDVDTNYVSLYLSQVVDKTARTQLFSAIDILAGSTEPAPTPVSLGE